LRKSVGSTRRVATVLEEGRKKKRVYRLGKGFEGPPSAFRWWGSGETGGRGGKRVKTRIAFATEEGWVDQVHSEMAEEEVAGEGKIGAKKERRRQ